jgi:hypothetical protein
MIGSLVLLITDTSIDRYVGDVHLFVVHIESNRTILPLTTRFCTTVTGTSFFNVATCDEEVQVDIIVV